MIGRAMALLLWLVPAPAFAAADPTRFMPAELIAQSLTPRPGSTILVGFRMSPKPGWHGYWSNPGDSGIAPSVTWSVPTGVRVGPLLHPAPKLIGADGISSFVHEGGHVLLARLTVDRSIPAGSPIPVQAQLNWAACTASKCVPLQSSFRLDLTAGDGAPSGDANALRAAQQALPKLAAPGQFSVKGRALSLRVPAALSLNPHTLRFFPDDNDAFDVAKARVTDDVGQIVLTGNARTVPETSIDGVLTDGQRAYRLSFNRGVAPAPTRASHRAKPAASPLNQRPAQSEQNSFARAEGEEAVPEAKSRALLLLLGLGMAAVGTLLWRRFR